MRASLLNRYRAWKMKVRIHNPDQVETDVITDNVGNPFLALKVKEGSRYDVYILEKEDAIGVLDSVLEEMRLNGWTHSDE